MWTTSTASNWSRRKGRRQTVRPLPLVDPPGSRGAAPPRLQRVEKGWKRTRSGQVKEKKRYPAPGSLRGANANFRYFQRELSPVEPCCPTWRMRCSLAMTSTACVRASKKEGAGSRTGARAANVSPSGASFSPEVDTLELGWNERSCSSLLQAFKSVVFTED
jgi:hypothetical protein